MGSFKITPNVGVRWELFFGTLAIAFTDQLQTTQCFLSGVVFLFFNRKEKLYKYIPVIEFRSCCK